MLGGQALLAAGSLPRSFRYERWCEGTCVGGEPGKLMTVNRGCKLIGVRCYALKGHCGSAGCPGPPMVFSRVVAQSEILAPWQVSKEEQQTPPEVREPVAVAEDKEMLVGGFLA
ncbi:hypothetical protein NDU88_002419 [Pleurodeles waltl]|uniref:Uncharacterized protein n=1 Tax=Pleurodeles waltl TaxID=8319 RepID=A0AAV7U998_PLEWA|nr:hypothetical protein NDU88_002419 [Pleurodeles waltl]